MAILLYFFREYRFLIFPLVIIREKLRHYETASRKENSFHICDRREKKKNAGQKEKKKHVTEHITQVNVACGH